MTVTELRQRIAAVALREHLDAYAAALEAMQRVPFNALVKGDETAIALDRHRTGDMLLAAGLVRQARARCLALSRATPEAFRKAMRQM